MCGLFRHRGQPTANLHRLEAWVPQITVRVQRAHFLQGPPPYSRTVSNQNKSKKMFERNNIDSRNNRQAIAIELTLDDGRTLSGKVSVPHAKTAVDVLNGPGGFFEFHPFVGDREILAKDTVRSVRFVKVAQTRPLRTEDDDIGGFNPHKVLGLDKNASAGDARKAYHRLSKSYHPDRYASADLPSEVNDYLASVSRRINQAYGLLQEAEAKAKARSEPIFQSRGHPIYESADRAGRDQTSSRAVSWTSGS